MAKLKKFGGKCSRGHAMRFTGRRLVCDVCPREKAEARKVREHAAILCSMRAADEASRKPLTVPVVELFGRKAMFLHWRAYGAAQVPGGSYTFEAWAEAEAKLREGWEPRR